MTRIALGFDYGTESVRVLAVDVTDGRIVGQAVQHYRHGVLDRTLPTGEALPADYALQHPSDWLDDLAVACRAATQGLDPASIIGIGVDFTSCTMLPTTRDGTPLCLQERFARTPLAWPKLWKHHGAKEAVDRINAVARERREPWLARYGGVIGIEWFFPKVLETLQEAPEVYRAAEVYLEAGDWLVWQLTSSGDATQLVRSTCQAGYKGLWNRHGGFPSAEYFAAVHLELRDVVSRKMPGRLQAPGTRAGLLNAKVADPLGLRAGIPVSTAIIDAHAGVPGAGVADEGTLVLVLGTSACHMLNARVERLVPGIAGVVEDGILPGYFGYETGQSSVGDAFAWLVKTFNLSHAEMTARAAALPPGSGGVLAIDWLNGARTPLMDGRLSGALVGLTLTTRPEQMYRALIEATALGLRRIVETLRAGGVQVRRFVASGGLPGKSPLLMQIYADVLGEPIAVAATDQSVALGAAILGCLAAGPAASGYADAASAVQAMTPRAPAATYRPDPARGPAYVRLYEIYARLTDGEAPLAGAMRSLRSFA